MNEPTPQERIVTDRDINNAAGLTDGTAKEEKYFIQGAEYCRDEYEQHIAAHRETISALRQSLSEKEKEVEEAKSLLQESQHEIYLASHGNPELVEKIKLFLSRDSSFDNNVDLDEAIADYMADTNGEIDSNSLAQMIKERFNVYNKRGLSSNTQEGV